MCTLYVLQLPRYHELVTRQEEKKVSFSPHSHCVPHSHTHLYLYLYMYMYTTLFISHVVCIDKLLSVYTNRPSRVQGSMRSGLNSGQANLAMGQARMRTQKTRRNLTHMPKLLLDHDSRCRATYILYTTYWVCCVALPCCLSLLASFFLPSHLSNMYM